MHFKTGAIEKDKIREGPKVKPKKADKKEGKKKDDAQTPKEG